MLLLRCAYSCLAPPFHDAEYTTVLPSRVNSPDLHTPAQR